MSFSKKEAIDVSDLSASLPAAAAALSPEDRAGLVNALKNKLQNLSGQHADVLESLTPVVRKRVEALKEIQSHHDELEAKFFEERAALEAKYQKLYQPLYTKRYEIVNGIVEPEGVKSDNAVKLEEGQETEKGVPEFWLTAMKTNEILAEEISERDEEALKYLKDIKWCRIDDPKGFKLEFFFDTNPFFKNSVLTKTYHMIDEEEPILEKAIGTDIEWYPGKCLTHKILKKKPKKGSKNAKPITKTESCESFFNFFSPPEVPEDDDDLDEDAAEELQNQMEQDYDIGQTIRDKIIPHAVSWFTGEAAQGDEFEDMEDDDEEGDEDDEDDEEDDEDEDIYSAVDLLQRYKKERDELVVERENALRSAKDLGKKQAGDTSIARLNEFYAEFSLSEIEEATHNFDPSLKIGEGGYGSIYRGILRHTLVAVKVLDCDSSQGPSEFEQEVKVLSKLRHPNLITLIGACPEAWILVYEYLPNGSLEDCLSCKGNTPPLSWQTRIRIASELCSVLIFLHSCKPHSIIYGDLKPANILLDVNHVSKLSDFGICCLISQDELSSNNTTMCSRQDNPKGNLTYIDPEYLSTGELTRKSDVYSFGIILLRLLTGRPALGIAKEVKSALDKGNLKDVLDLSAGDWPFVRAKQLALLALSCCEMCRNNRPDLISEVWRMLEPMRVSCGAASSFRLGSEYHIQISQFYVCPIFQEIMQDPVVAADGYTYESEAIKGWLESGNDTSPMTDQKLADDILIPNHALRSAIQEWLQQP